MNDGILEVKEQFGAPGLYSERRGDKSVKYSSVSQNYMSEGEEKTVHRISIFVGVDNAVMDSVNPDENDLCFLGSQGTSFYLREGFCYDVESAIMFHEKLLKYLKEVKRKESDD